MAQEVQLTRAVLRHESREHERAREAEFKELDVAFKTQLSIVEMRHPGPNRGADIRDPVDIAVVFGLKDTRSVENFLANKGHFKTAIADLFWKRIFKLLLDHVVKESAYSRTPDSSALHELLARGINTLRNIDINERILLDDPNSRHRQLKVKHRLLYLMIGYTVPNFDIYTEVFIVTTFKELIGHRRVELIYEEGAVVFNIPQSRRTTANPLPRRMFSGPRRVMNLAETTAALEIGSSSEGTTTANANRYSPNRQYMTVASQFYNVLTPLHAPKKRLATEIVYIFRQQEGDFDIDGELLEEKLRWEHYFYYIFSSPLALSLVRPTGVTAEVGPRLAAEAEAALDRLDEDARVPATEAEAVLDRLNEDARVPTQGEGNRVPPLRTPPRPEPARDSPDFLSQGGFPHLH